MSLGMDVFNQRKSKTSQSAHPPVHSIYVHIKAKLLVSISVSLQSVQRTVTVLIVVSLKPEVYVCCGFLVVAVDGVVFFAVTSWSLFW